MEDNSRHGRSPKPDWGSAGIEEPGFLAENALAKAAAAHREAVRAIHRRLKEVQEQRMDVPRVLSCTGVS